MRGKLEGIMSINTSPVDNKFCNAMAKTDTICGECYSRKSMEGYLKICRPRWKTNGKILSSNIISLDELPTIKDDIFRFDAHGELHNNINLINYMNIAKVNPHCYIVLWTKRKELVKEQGRKIPKNLSLIYSTAKCDVLKPKRPAYFKKVFSVYTAQFAADNNIDINCGYADSCIACRPTREECRVCDVSKCAGCRLCYEDNDTVFVNEIIKSERAVYRNIMRKLHGLQTRATA